MKRFFDRESIYDFTDAEIMQEICRRIKMVRRSMCLSQEEFARQTQVSRETVKRIESGRMQNIGFASLLKIMRAGRVLEGVADLIEEVPESPFLHIGRETERKRISSSLMKNQ